MAVLVILNVIISSELKVLSPAKSPFLPSIFAQVVANKCYKEQGKQGLSLDALDILIVKPP